MPFSNTGGLVADLTTAFTPTDNESTVAATIGEAMAKYLVEEFAMPGTNTPVSQLSTNISAGLSGMSKDGAFPGLLANAVTVACQEIAMTPPVVVAVSSVPPGGSPAYTFPAGGSAGDAANEIAAKTMAYVLGGTFVSPPPSNTPGTWS